MAQVVIENPILNSPFCEPVRHFKFDDDGITNEIIPRRRTSTYFVPIPKPKKKGKQLVLDQDWTQDRVVENELVDRIRPKVKQWRQGGYAGITPTTRRLLEHWTDPEREKKLFFCQIEAPETAQALWLPAVNAHGGLGRWALVKIQDPWHCMNKIRGAIRAE